MTKKFSTIVLSGSAAVAMLFASATVSSAGGLTTLCLPISTVPSEVAAELDGLDLSSLGSKECKKVCKEAKKLCTSLSKNRADCEDSVNKTASKAEQAQCTIDFPADKSALKECQKSAKDTEKANKNAIKDEEKTTSKDGCGSLDSDCQASCGS